MWEMASSEQDKEQLFVFLNVSAFVLKLMDSSKLKLDQSFELVYLLLSCLNVI